VVRLSAIPEIEGMTLKSIGFVLAGRCANLTWRVSPQVQLFSAKALLVLVGLSLMLAMTSGATFAQTTNSPAGLSAGVVAPDSAIDLLRNIKVAIDRSLLIRRDFYSDESLRRFFGGEKVLWGKDTVDPAELFGYVYDFGPWGVETNTLSGRPLDKLTLAFRREVGPKGMVAELLLHLPGYESDRPSFGEVETVYGANWELDNEPFQRGVRRVYRIEKQELSTIASFEFAFDGRLRVANIVMKGPVQ
jgi:hypothetical protein